MSSRRRAEAARAVLTQVLGGLLFLAMAGGIITIGVLLGQTRSSQVTFDPADPVFHGTNTSNTVLGTTTVGPGFARTLGTTSAPRAQINIGAYDSTPNLSPAYLTSPPANLAYRAIHIGMTSLTNSSAIASIAIGTRFQCGSGIGNSGHESICIGTNGVNFGIQNVWIGASNLCVANSNSHVIGFQNSIGDDTSNQNAIFGTGNNIVTSSNANIVGVGNSITSSDNSHVMGNQNSMTSSTTSVLIGSAGSITNAVGSVAIGSNVQSTVANGIALGNGAVASPQNLALGETNAVLSINVGDPVDGNTNSPIQNGDPGAASLHLLILINGKRYKIPLVPDFPVKK